MGFLLTLFYIGLAILSPAELFPALGPYRVMVWISVLAIFASIPSLLNSTWLRLPHTYLMLGIILAICLSRLLNGWVGGVPLALTIFLPIAMIFFLVLWNVKTLPQFRALTAMLIVIGLYSIVRGAIAYYSDDKNSLYVVSQPVWINESLGIRISYLRIRALGFLNDPNDFAQYLLMLLPLLIPVWQAGRFFRNCLLCLLPAGLLLFGIYLTDSRGALLGLALLLMFLLKDRVGRVGAALIAPLVVIAILAFNHGNRSISVHEDSALGRVNAWSEGLGMFEHSPVWGVGFGEFTNYHEITAHNSYVLCMSELGLIGCVAWVGLISASVLQLQTVGSGVGSKIDRDEDKADEKADNEDGDESDEKGTQDWAFSLRSALYTLLATCWFLSRTYSATLYLLLGMSVALSAQGERALVFGVPKTHWFRITLLAVPLLILAVYATVRMRAL